jgi:hypothetical protein
MSNIHDCLLLIIKQTNKQTNKQINEMFNTIIVNCGYFIREYYDIVFNKL